MKYNSTKYNSTKYNSTKYNSTKYNSTKYNSTSFNDKYCVFIWFATQGVANRFDDRSTEAEKNLERLRQMPFHMHINVDMLDGVHLLTAMMLEVL